MPMTEKKKPLTDQLRQFIEDAGVTRYRLSQQTGIDQAVLSRFVRGTGGLSMDGLNTLADALNLELTKRPKPAAKSRKGN
jgi:transcriptional regulator with XRE-family HTH domain